MTFGSRGLRDLGKALIPAEYASAARDRIPYYFRKYPGIIIRGDDLLVVSWIQEYARRLRELRVQFGWAIVRASRSRRCAKRRRRKCRMGSRP